MEKSETKKDDGMGMRGEQSFFACLMIFFGCYGFSWEKKNRLFTSFF